MLYRTPIAPINMPNKIKAKYFLNIRNSKRSLDNVIIRLSPENCHRSRTAYKYTKHGRNYQTRFNILGHFFKSKHGRPMVRRKPLPDRCLRRQSLKLQLGIVQLEDSAGSTADGKPPSGRLDLLGQVPSASQRQKAAEKFYKKDWQACRLMFVVPHGLNVLNSLPPAVGAKRTKNLPTTGAADANYN